ncbi:MAG: hypothetical protein NC408_02545 [Candidatus Gastranaerophilales bacterium]|nr:hypothetical protein [Candidatus Gastranaerophilales bacterium]MCM1072536.1 hypothetical protein [Bacteroides sp.]
MINAVKNYYNPFSSTFKDRVLSRPNMDLVQVRKKFGKLGCDIFEGKEKISIIENPPKTNFKEKTKRFLNEIFCPDSLPQDFQEKDSPIILLFKFFHNNGDVVPENEVSEMFGEEGLKTLAFMESAGLAKK